MLFNMAKDSHDKGDFFPIYGICLGYELLTVLVDGTRGILTNCSSDDVALKLNFYPGINLNTFFILYRLKYYL